MTIFYRLWLKLYWYCLQLKGYLVFGRRVYVHGNFDVANPSKVRIGHGCSINHNAFILGHYGIDIGNNVIISAGAQLIDAGLDTKSFTDEVDPPHVSSKIIISDGCWIGAGAIILPGVTLGQKCIVGAGSVVNRDFPAFTVLAGSPARIIRNLNGNG